MKSGATADVGTELTDGTVSYGQGGGGMTSTMNDLGVWAASGTNDVLLPAELVTDRNRMAPLAEVPAYGKGVLALGDWVGHEGETRGWETLTLTDPRTAPPSPWPPTPAESSAPSSQPPPRHTPTSPSRSADNPATDTTTRMHPRCATPSTTGPADGSAAQAAWSAGCHP